ncbi:MAG TPA: serine protease [Pyrinomonadaceae bacterium]|nr:serine protease [Pyrinomonadaceae bacterium]
MASGLVVHIEVAGERHTELLTHERIRIGTREDCDLRLRPEALPAAGGDLVLLELARANGHYRVADFTPALPLSHNGLPIARGASVEDGDRVSGGADEQQTLTLQFFPVEAPSAIATAGRRAEPFVAPFIEHAAMEAAATARRDDAKVFLREFTRELVREISWSTKIITLLIAVALVGGMLYFGFAAFDELKRSRRRLEEQNAQIALLNQQVRESQNQFAGVRQTNEDIINSLSLAPKLRGEYGNGVCLISGLYIFVEAGTGRPLRYPGSQAAASPADPAAVVPDAEQETTFLTPDGDGPVAEFPYVGTGFHVGGGYIVTNRHVASEPWSADERAMVFGSAVAGRPRISKLLAYFPERSQGFPLKVRQVSQRDDLAVAQIEPAESLGSIPTLPLEGEGPASPTAAATVGKPVVLMGYPSGPDRILASLPDEQATEIKQRYGASLDVLVSRLAELKVLKPLLTQGHITDLETRRIVYDARTGQGGSGAPLFGPSGRVIGVNFAVFVEIADANFAVPIRYALPLLERAGWKNPAAQAAPDAAGKDDQKETKPAEAAKPR